MDTDIITPISKPYLLITFLPFHVDNAGEVWLDHCLWHKDLVEHTVYIKNLLLLAPKHPILDFSDPVKMSIDEAKRIKFIGLPRVNFPGWGA